MPQVLVLEHDATIRLTLSYVLRKAGYAVSACCHAAEALDLVRSRGFSVVLADVALCSVGEAQGLELLRAIRRAQPGIRVLVMMTGDRPELRERALAAGAWACWKKPLSMEKLAEELLRWGPAIAGREKRS